MLPIVDIPLVVKTFCLRFRSVFNRIEQYDHFQAFITALSLSETRTVAGIHQQLVDGPTYQSLHHFMSKSPWSVEELSRQRLQYVKEQVTDRPSNEPDVQLLAMGHDTVTGTTGSNNYKEDDKMSELSQLVGKVDAERDTASPRERKHAEP